YASVASDGRTCTSPSLSVPRALASATAWSSACHALAEPSIATRIRLNIALHPFALEIPRGTFIVRSCMSHGKGADVAAKGGQLPASDLRESRRDLSKWKEAGGCAGTPPAGRTAIGSR